MSNKCNCTQEGKLPPIKDDTIFICHSIETTSGQGYLDGHSVHITFQEIGDCGSKPKFYSIRLGMSKKNRALLEKITTEKVSFKEIKSIEQ